MKKGIIDDTTGFIRDDDGSDARGAWAYRTQGSVVSPPRAVPAVDVPVMHRPRGRLGPRAHVTAPPPRHRRADARVLVRAVASRVRGRVRGGILHGRAHVAAVGGSVAVLRAAPPRDALLGALKIRPGDAPPRGPGVHGRLRHRSASATPSGCCPNFEPATKRCDVDEPQFWQFSGCV